MKEEIMIMNMVKIGNSEKKKCFGNIAGRYLEST